MEKVRIEADRKKKNSVIGKVIAGPSAGKIVFFSGSQPQINNIVILEDVEDKGRFLICGLWRGNVQQEETLEYARNCFVLKNELSRLRIAVQMRKEELDINVEKSGYRSGSLRTQNLTVKNRFHSDVKAVRNGDKMKIIPVSQADVNEETRCVYSEMNISLAPMDNILVEAKMLAIGEVSRQLYWRDGVKKEIPTLSMPFADIENVEFWNIEKKEDIPKNAKKGDKFLVSFTAVLDKYGLWRIFYLRKFSGFSETKMYGPIEFKKL